MSGLRPTGVPFLIGGEERHLLFTLNAIEEIQEYYDQPLSEVMEKLTDVQEQVPVLRSLVSILLNDEAQRLGGDRKTYTEEEIGWEITIADQIDCLRAVLKAYAGSLPEADGEEEDPNRKSGSMKA